MSAQGTDFFSISFRRPSFVQNLTKCSLWPYDAVTPLMSQSSIWNYVLSLATNFVFSVVATTSVATGVGEILHPLWQE